MVKFKECNEFYYYWLKSPYGQYMLNSIVTGSAQPKFNKTNFRDMVAPVPQMKIQEKIASILGILDDKIELNNALNNNLEQQMQSYYQYLFLDNADSAWRIGSISDLGEVVGGSTPSKKNPEYYTEKGIAWITPKDLSNDKSKFISHGEIDITEQGLKNSSARIMPKGTILFSSRAPIGYIAVADGDVTTNQGFKSIIPKAEIGSAFAYFFLKNNLPIIEGMASGSTFKEISGSTMKKVPATIPDKKTLGQFRTFCEPIFMEQSALEKEIKILSKTRDILLPKLMSGELDVSELDL